MSSRIDGRAPNQLRPISFTRNWLNNAEGSVLVEFGNTRVLCVASFTREFHDGLQGRERVG
jgi:ribonuclease PH